MTIASPFERGGLAAKRDLPQRRAERVDADERDGGAGAHPLLGNAHAADADHEHERSEERRR